MRNFIVLAFLLAATPGWAQDVPNDFATVQAVFATGQHNLTTNEGSCAFTDAVVRALHQKDGNWGHILKTTPKNGCYGEGKGHAVYFILYRSSLRGVDIIRQQGAPDAGISWQVNPGAGEPTDCDMTGCWWAPLIGTPPTPPAPPTPPSLPPTPPLDLSSLHKAIGDVRLDLVRIESQVQAIATSLEEHRAAERSFRDKVVGFLTDSKTISIVLGIIAGRYIVPGGN